MSKSLGNSPDPLDLIAKYGADALRFGLMRSAPLGQDIRFDEKQIEVGRNFCNKLWNACRFRQMQGGETEGEIDPTRSDERRQMDPVAPRHRDPRRDRGARGYHFNEAAQALYRFFWSEYCDWYLEASKASLGSAATRVPRLAIRRANRERSLPKRLMASRHQRHASRVRSPEMAARRGKRTRWR